MEHRFLSMEENAMSASEAEEYLREVLKDRGIEVAASYAFGGGRTITHGGLVGEAMNVGCCTVLARHEPSYFPLMATTSTAIGLEITMGNKKFGPITGPCRATTAVEEELATDVLHYRREAVQASGEHDFAQTSRAYRSYLTACVSLVDSAINRLAWLRLQQPAGLDVKGRKVLENKRRPILEKLGSWPVLLGSDAPLDESAPYWRAFNQLRGSRNGYVHASPPYFEFGLARMADDLNLCREGCGRLLIELRTRLGLPIWPAHEMVLRAPIVSFVSK